MTIAILMPSNRLRLNAALDWYHTGHPDHSGFDWSRECRRVRHPVRAALASDSLKAWLLREDGSELDIPPHLWAGTQLWAEAYSPALVNVHIKGILATGYLLVNSTEFENLMAGKSSPEPSNKLPEYTPPFLGYMLELVERFDLTAAYNFDRSILGEWIFHNPPELPVGAKWSEAKAEMMARFLGNPAHERGGNKPASFGKRSANPLDPFEGVHYPKPRKKP